MLLYDVFPAHGSGFDRDIPLPTPDEAGMRAACTNWDGRVLVSVPNALGWRARELILTDLRNRAEVLRRQVPLPEGGYGALMQAVGITERDCREATREIDGHPSAYMIRAWVDAGRPEVPPEFVWREA